MEEMLVALEYIKQKDNSLVSIVHLYEEKHGYGVAFNEKGKRHLGEATIWKCMLKVITFVTDDIYAATNEQINAVRVRQLMRSNITEMIDNAQVIPQALPSVSVVINRNNFLTVNIPFLFIPLLTN